MGFTFDLSKNKVVLQKSHKKVKFEKEDYRCLFQRLSKISRRLKKKDLFGETWSGFTIELKRVVNIGGIILSAIQCEQLIAIWRSLEKGVYYFS